jgi:hypothetical protein
VSNPLESLLTKVPARTLRIVVLPALLSLLGTVSVYAWAAAKVWKAEVDAVIKEAPSLLSLSKDVRDIRRMQLEQYRDLLAFQRDIYQALDERDKAAAADRKSTNLQ